MGQPQGHDIAFFFFKFQLQGALGLKACLKVIPCIHSIILGIVDSAPCHSKQIIDSKNV